jgi:hypothetical protein
MMNRDQNIVAVGAASGVATMVVAVAGACELWPVNTDLGDINRRLAHAL